MEKILLIIKREYLSRVKKKSFLLVTFLVPLLFIVVWGGSIYLAAQDTDTVSQVSVIDDTGLFAGQLEDSKTLIFETAHESAATLKQSLTDEKSKDHYLLIIPKDIEQTQRVELFSSAKSSIFIQERITDQLNEVLRNIELQNADIDVATIERINPNIQIASKEITDAGERSSSAGAAMGIAMFSSIIIYLTLFIYGAQVMRGVIEEKNNRIVEIIISSVKPFQLMMGKILGIGLVGLTQFILWIVVFGLLSAIGSAALSGNLSSEDLQQVAGATQMQGGPIQEMQSALQTLDFALIISCFLIYFIGGYMLYSALFAAVGSAVDNETETQQFMLPITMPLLFTYMLSFSVLLKDPNGSLSVWLSMIPFTSPIAMMVRIPFGVPLWQLAVSIMLLIAGFLLTTWVAARIYRVGILMYGKKASYKELIKWFGYRR